MEKQRKGNKRKPKVNHTIWQDIGVKNWTKCPIQNIKEKTEDLRSTKGV